MNALSVCLEGPHAELQSAELVQSLQSSVHILMDMAPLIHLQSANHRSLKRPFTSDTTNTTSSDIATGSNSENLWARRLRVEEVSDLTTTKESEGSAYMKMPSEASPVVHGSSQVPSFMSVYGVEAKSVTNSTTPQTQFKQTFLSSTRPDTVSVPALVHHHQHHESTSTTSDSTDSSPTTTISTIDSSSMSDPSPSSSPESPITVIPLSSFAGSNFGLDSYPPLKMNENNLIQPPMSEERPMTSPSPRRFKNHKSLALDLNPVSTPVPETFQASEPASPSFIKPPPLKARKKPSLLSLNTGAANRLALSVEPLASPSVPTMLQRRGLKHSMSSPQILATPSFGPAGGMTLGERKPGPSRFRDLSLSTNTFTINEDAHDAPAGVQMATRVPGVSVGGDTFDRPHTGEDAKSPSYPEGPILMHEPSVHLYSEPKLEEALNFDVIINVAREVKNPFNATKEEPERPTLTTSFSEPASTVDTVPDTAMSFASFKTAYETQPTSSTESSPTTPKPSSESKRPEYIHIPWDHNTDVKDELWDLCQLIELRTKEGKKVLVHCQQGASRSATLIIAYGMYLHQDMSATEAYAMAQSKSRWVNPNMSLLFSLNDFKKIIEKKKTEANAAPESRPLIKHRPTLSAVTSDTPMTLSRARGNSTPSTAVRDRVLARVDDSPIPTQSAIERLGSFDFGFDQMTLNSPQSSPEARIESFPAQQVTMLPPPVPHRHAPSPPKSNLVEQMFSQSSSRPQPLIQQTQSTSTSNNYEELMSPRVMEMTNNPIQGFSRNFVAAEEEVSTAPFSPRAFEFPRTTFFPPETDENTAPLTVDPRSPPTKGEAPITRSIDDVL